MEKRIGHRLRAPNDLLQPASSQSVFVKPRRAFKQTESVLAEQEAPSDEEAADPAALVWPHRILAVTNCFTETFSRLREEIVRGPEVQQLQGGLEGRRAED